MVSTAHTSHPIVVVRRPGRIGAFLTLMKAISQSVAAAATTFPKPDPTIAQLDADISALDAAETSAKKRMPGAVVARNDQRVVVGHDLVRLVTYVQGVVNLDPTHAANIAAAAGMGLRKVGTRTKALLTAKPHTISGSVKLVAKVVSKHTSNEWQYSVDSGKTWVAAPSTIQAKTIIPGLTPGVLTQFRHRANTTSGPDNWSQTVALMVV